MLRQVWAFALFTPCIFCTFALLLSKVVISLNVLTECLPDGRQVMTIQDISASFQTIPLLQCESTSDLTDIVKPGRCEASVLP